MSFGTGEGAQDYDQNLVGRISAEIQNFHPQGYLWHNDDTIGSLTIDLITIDVPVVATGWQESKVKASTDYLTLDAANGTITIGDKGRGIYKVKICSSFSSSKNNIELHGEVFLTPSGGSAGLLEEVAWERTIGAAAAVGDSRRDNKILLNPGDVLDYRFHASGVPATVALRHASFAVSWWSGA